MYSVSGYPSEKKKNPQDLWSYEKIKSILETQYGNMWIIINS